MRRSKYGYLLLALLVITGLAGTITSTSITSKERKFAVAHLKDVRIDVLKSVNILSRAQLNYKSDAVGRSIKECVYHLAASETSLWESLQNVMKQPANPEKRSEIKLSDDQVLNLAEEGANISKTTENPGRKDKLYKNIDDAIASFKALRAEHIKYMKTTTEDLRNHVIRLSIGWLDCYQLCLFMSAHSNSHIKQIEEIEADPNFPSRYISGK